MKNNFHRGKSVTPHNHTQQIIRKNQESAHNPSSDKGFTNYVNNACDFHQDNAYVPKLNEDLLLKRKYLQGVQSQQSHNRQHNPTENLPRLKSQEDLRPKQIPQKIIHVEQAKNNSVQDAKWKYREELLQQIEEQRKRKEEEKRKLKEEHTYINQIEKYPNKLVKKVDPNRPSDENPQADRYKEYVNNDYKIKTALQENSNHRLNIVFENTHPSEIEAEYMKEITELKKERENARTQMLDMKEMILKEREKQLECMLAMIRANQYTDPYFKQKFPRINNHSRNSSIHSNPYYSNVQDSILKPKLHGVIIPNNNVNTKMYEYNISNKPNKNESESQQTEYRFSLPDPYVDISPYPNPFEKILEDPKITRPKEIELEVLENSLTNSTK